MIYKDPIVNAEAKDGKWFAWYPVQLEGENRTAWLCFVRREWQSALYYYYRIKKERE